mmetsp:Transcript_91847/g.137569  ORF Transcript_91847/g.137569 Transcript_91847/m.137569 type:complete len:222 (+) Transcript_91847:152-817(+)
MIASPFHFFKPQDYIHFFDLLLLLPFLGAGSAFALLAERPLLGGCFFSAGDFVFLTAAEARDVLLTGVLGFNFEIGSSSLSSSPSTDSFFTSASFFSSFSSSASFFTIGLGLSFTALLAELLGLSAFAAGAALGTEAGVAAAAAFFLLFRGALVTQTNSLLARLIVIWTFLLSSSVGLSALDFKSREFIKLSKAFSRRSSSLALNVITVSGSGGSSGAAAG